MAVGGVEGGGGGVERTGARERKKRIKMALSALFVLAILVISPFFTIMETVQFKKYSSGISITAESKTVMNLTYYAKDDGAYNISDTNDVLNGTEPTRSDAEMSGEGNYDMDDTAIYGRPMLTLASGGYNIGSGTQYHEWNTTPFSSSFPAYGSANLTVNVSSEYPEEMTLGAEMFEGNYSTILYLHGSDAMLTNSSTGASLADLDADGKSGITLNQSATYHEWNYTMPDALVVSGLVDLFLWVKRGDGLGSVSLTATIYKSGTAITRGTSTITYSSWNTTWMQYQFPMERISTTFSAGNVLKLRVARADTDADDVYIGYDASTNESALKIVSYTPLSRTYYLHADAPYDATNVADQMNTTASSGAGAVDYDGDGSDGVNMSTTETHNWSAVIDASSDYAIDDDINVYLRMSRTGQINSTLILNVALYNYTTGWPRAFISNTSVTSNFSESWSSIEFTVPISPRTIKQGDYMIVEVNRTDGVTSDFVILGYNTTDNESYMSFPGAVASYTLSPWPQLWTTAALNFTPSKTIAAGNWLMLRVWRSDSGIRKMYIGYDINTTFESKLNLTTPTYGAGWTAFYLTDDGSYVNTDTGDYLRALPPQYARAIWDGAEGGGDYDNDSYQQMKPGLTIEDGGYDSANARSYQDWVSDTLQDAFTAGGPVDILSWTKCSVDYNMTLRYEILEKRANDNYSKFYLRYDSNASNELDSLSNITPSSSSLSDYDFDGTTGATVGPGGYNASNNVSYKDFTTGTLTNTSTLWADNVYINGDVKVSLWTNASAGSAATLRATLMDRTGNYTFPDRYEEIGVATYILAAWPTTWTETVFNFTGINYTVYEDHSLVLRIDMSSGNVNILLAYDTTTYSSYINYTTRYVCAANLDETADAWNMYWDRTTLSSSAVIYTWTGGNNIVLRASRRDSNGGLMYVSYDSIDFNSSLRIYLAAPTRFYLYDDEAYDEDDVTDWIVPTVVPDVNRNMEKGAPDGGNFDADAQPPPGKPGLTIEVGGYLPSEPTQYHDWNTTDITSGLDMRGTVDVSMWSMASLVANMTMQIDLYDLDVYRNFMDDDSAYSSTDVLDPTSRSAPLVTRDPFEGEPAGGDFDNDDGRPGITLMAGGWGMDYDVYIGSGTGTSVFYENGGSRSNLYWSAKSAWNLGDYGTDAVPCFGDLDGDGDYDLMVGDAAASGGKMVKAYKNTGNSTVPAWTAEATWDMSTSTTDPAPELVDIDNDGDLDLFVGNLGGTVVAYQNTGGTASPTWTAAAGWNGADVGATSKPAFADIDGDGDYDMFVGDDTAQRVVGYNNTGSKASPVWTAKTEWLVNAANVSDYPRPALVDIDDDGDFDMFVGISDGTTQAYMNIGNKSVPHFIRWSTWDLADVGTNAAPAFIDIDHDLTTDPQQYHEWNTTTAGSTTRMRGTIEIVLWTRCESASTGVGLLIEATNMSYRRIGANRTYNSEWPMEWTKSTFYIENIDDNISSGNMLRLRIARTDTSTARLYVAYDIASMPSYMQIEDRAFVAYVNPNATSAGTTLYALNLTSASTSYTFASGRTVVLRINGTEEDHLVSNVTMGSNGTQKYNTYTATYDSDGHAHQIMESAAATCELNISYTFNTRSGTWYNTTDISAIELRMHSWYGTTAPEDAPVVYPYDYSTGTYDTNGVITISATADGSAAYYTAALENRHVSTTTGEVTVRVKSGTWSDSEQNTLFMDYMYLVVTKKDLILAYNDTTYDANVFLTATPSTKYYLHDDAGNDYNDSVDTADTSASAGSLADVDNDGLPGLTLTGGRYAVADHTKYHEWHSNATTASLATSGIIYTNLWWNSTALANQTLYGQVFDVLTTKYYLHDMGTYDIFDTSDNLTTAVPSIARTMYTASPSGGDFDADEKYPGLTVVGGGYDSRKSLSYVEWNLSQQSETLELTGDATVGVWTKAYNWANITLNLSLYDYNPTDATYYLEDDGSYDWADATDSMSTSSPSMSRSMSYGPTVGGDFDDDNDEGLTLVAGEYSASAPRQYHDWTSAAISSGLHMSGTVYVSVWAKVGSINQSMTLRMKLYDYNPTTLTYTLIDTATYSSTNWSTSWAKVTVNFVGIEYAMSAYHSLMLRADRTDVDTDEMYLAYDSSVYPANIDINPYYEYLGDNVSTDSNWSREWTMNNYTIEDLSVTIPAGDMLVLRASREDKNDVDMLVGENGGTTYCYQNTGSSIAPIWTAKSTWNLPDAGTDSNPAIGDLDADGDQDCLVGDNTNNMIYAYENIGTIYEPVWTRKGDWDLTPQAAEDRPGPVLADLDGDDDFDVLVGEQGGLCYAYENIGLITWPEWARRPAWDMTTDIGSDAKPAFVDLDNDGDYDLMIGENNGPINCFENTGDATDPIWTAKAAWSTTDSHTGGNPAMADLDNDGDVDMMVGTDPGNITAYENVGSSASPTWNYHLSWDIADIGTSSAPDLLDLDSDTERLFIAYDTTTYSSNINITRAANTLIGEGSTTSTWGTAWTNTSITIPTVDYDLENGHGLMVRADLYIPPAEETPDLFPTMTYGNVTGASYTATQTNNGNYQALAETTAGGTKKGIDLYYTLDTNISKSDISTLKLYVNAWCTDNDTTNEQLDVYVWNYQTSAWTQTTITVSATSDTTPYSDTTTMTADYVETATGNMRVRFLDNYRTNGENTDWLFVDQIYVEVTGGKMNIAYNASSYESYLSLPDGANYFFHDDLTYYASDTADTMDNVTSAGGNISDVDVDGTLGLTIITGYYDASYPTHGHDWNTTEFTTGWSISGNVYVKLWLNATMADLGATVRVKLYDTTSAGATVYYLHDDANYTVSDRSDWMNTTAATSTREMYDAAPDGGDFDVDNRKPGQTIEEGGYNELLPTRYHEWNITTLTDDIWVMEDAEIAMWMRAQERTSMEINASLWDTVATDTTYYLLDDGAYSATDADDTLGTTYPARNRNLAAGAPYGGDYDVDGNPGRSIATGGYASGQPTRYQNWSIAMAADTLIGGEADIKFWAQGTTGKSTTFTFRGRLYDIDAAGAATLLGTNTKSVDLSRKQWTAVSFSVTLTNLISTIASGHSLRLMIDRTDADAATIRVAYDSTSYPAYMDFSPYYSYMGSSMFNNSGVAFNAYWTNYSFSVQNMNYTVATGHTVVLRLERNDSATSPLFVMYDSPDYASYFIFGVYTSIGNGTNQTDSWDVAWWDTKVSIGVNYTLPVNHQLAVRASRTDVDSRYMFLGYDTSDYDSYVYLKGNDSTIYGGGENDTSTWNTSWSLTTISLGNLTSNYYISSASNLVLRLQRTDTATDTDMYIGYDGLNNASYLNITTGAGGSGGTTTYYLHDDDTLSGSDFIDNMSTSGASVGAIGDYDSDGYDGLTLKAGLYDVTEASQFHEWNITLPSDLTLYGEAKLYIYTKGKYDSHMTLNASFINRTGGDVALYFMQDDETYDDTDTGDWLTALVPDESRNMYASSESSPVGGDYDDDNDLVLKPGLTLEFGGYNTSVANQSHDWVSDSLSSGTAIRGDVEISIWTIAPAAEDMTLKLELYVSNSSVVYYMRDDGTYDKTDSQDILNSTAPSSDRDMYVGSPSGGDFDEDAPKPGLTVTASSYDAVSGIHDTMYPSTYHIWNATYGAATLSGTVNVNLYTKTDVNDSMSLNVSLLDIDPTYEPFTTYYLWDDESYSVSDRTDTLKAEKPIRTNLTNMDVDAYSGLTVWKYSAPFNGTEYIDFESAALSSNLYIRGNVTVFLWAARYGGTSGSYTVSATLHDNVGGTTMIGSTASYTNADWPSTMYGFKITIPVSGYNLSAGNKLVLRVHVNESSAGSCMYFAYNSTTYRAHMMLPNAYLIAQGNNTATYTTSWTQTTVALTGVSYTVAAGHMLGLMVRRADVSAERIFIAYDDTTYNSSVFLVGPGLIYYLRDDGAYNISDTRDWLSAAAPSVARGWTTEPPDATSGDYDTDGAKPGISLISGGYDDTDPRSYHEWNVSLDASTYPNGLAIAGNAVISVYTKAAEEANATLKAELFAKAEPDATYYFHDDGTLTASDQYDYMDDNTTTLTTVTDFDADGNPGLSISTGTYNPSSPTASRGHEWWGSPLTSSLTIRGDVYVDLWAREGGTGTYTLRVRIYDYNPTGSTYTEIGGASTSYDFPASWYNPAFTIPYINYTVAGAHRIVVIADRTDTNANALYLAYNTTTEYSRVKINRYYRSIGSSTLQQEYWPTEWMQNNITISSLNDVVSAADDLTLRLTRTDSNADYLFVGYDALDMQAKIALQTASLTQVASMTNQSSLTTTWTLVNFTTTASTSIIPGHSLLARVDIADNFTARPGADPTITAGTVSPSSGYSRTWEDDGTNQYMTEASFGGRYRIDEFYTLQSNLSKSLTTSLTLRLNAWQTDLDGDTFAVYVYDFTASAWDATTITITASTDGTTYTDSTLVVADHVSAGGVIQVRIADTTAYGDTTTQDSVYIDYLGVEAGGVKVFLGYNSTNNETYLRVKHAATFTNEYFHDDGTYYASDATDVLDTGTSLAANLSNTDVDAYDGLTLYPGGYDANYPTRYHDWNTSAMDDYFVITELWGYLRMNASASIMLTMRMRVYDAVLNETFYLHDDGVYDVDDAEDTANTTQPTYATRNMYMGSSASPPGGDFDGDNLRPGLTLISGGYDRTKAKQYHEWLTSAFADSEDVTGTLGVTLWAMSEYASDMELNISLYDWDAVTSLDSYDWASNAIGNDSIAMTPWPMTWTRVEAEFSTTGRTIAEGHKVIARIWRNDTSDYEMYIAYDTTTMASYVDLGSRFKSLGEDIYNDPAWPIDWEQLTFTISDIDYTLDAGAQLLLRATRVDETDQYMFLGYDTLDFPADVTIENKESNTVFTDDVNESWQSDSWYEANFTATGLTFSAPVNSTFVVRAEVNSSMKLSTSGEPAMIVSCTPPAAGYGYSVVNDGSTQNWTESEISAGVYGFDGYYSYNSSVADTQITDIEIGINAWWTNKATNPGDDTVDLYVYNWDTSGWDATLITISATTDGTLYTDSLTAGAAHVGGTGNVRVRLVDSYRGTESSAMADTLYVDYVYVDVKREVEIGYNTSNYECVVDIVNPYGNHTYYYLHDDESATTTDSTDPMDDSASQTTPILDLDVDGKSGLTLKEGGYDRNYSMQYHEWSSDDIPSAMSIASVEVTLWIKGYVAVALPVKVSLINIVVLNYTSYYLADDAEYDVNDTEDYLYLANGSGGTYEPTEDRDMYEGPDLGGDYDYDCPSQDIRPGLSVRYGGYDVSDPKTYQWFNTTNFVNPFRIYGELNISVWVMPQRGYEDYTLHALVYDWNGADTNFTGTDYGGVSSPGSNYTLIGEMSYVNSSLPANTWTQATFVSDSIDYMVSDEHGLVVLMERTDTTGYLLYAAYDSVTMASALLVNFPAAYTPYYMRDDGNYNYTDTTDWLANETTWPNWTIDAYVGIEYYYPLYTYNSLYYGGDFDNDSSTPLKPGLTMMYEGYNLTGWNGTGQMYDLAYNITNMTKHHWLGLDPGGTITALNLCLYIMSPTVENDVTLNVTYYSYNTGTGVNTQIATTQHVLADAANYWTKYWINITGLSVSLGGNMLRLNVSRNDSSLAPCQEAIYIMYDTPTFESYLNITKGTTTTYYLHYNEAHSVEDLEEGMDTTASTTQRNPFTFPPGGDYDNDNPKEKIKPGLTLKSYSQAGWSDPSSYHFFDLTPELSSSLEVYGLVNLSMYAMCPTENQNMTLNLTLYDWDNATSYFSGGAPLDPANTSELAAWQMIAYNTYTNATFPISWTFLNVTRSDVQMIIDSGHRAVLMIKRDDSNLEEMYIAYDTLEYPSAVKFQYRQSPKVEWFRTYNTTTWQREWFFNRSDSMLIRVNFSGAVSGLTITMNITDYSNTTRLNDAALTLESDGGTYKIYNYTYNPIYATGTRGQWVAEFLFTDSDEVIVFKWKEVFEVTG